MWFTPKGWRSFSSLPRKLKHPGLPRNTYYALTVLVVMLSAGYHDSLKHLAHSESGIKRGKRGYIILWSITRPWKKTDTRYRRCFYVKCIAPDLNKKITTIESHKNRIQAVNLILVLIAPTMCADQFGGKETIANICCMCITGTWLLDVTTVHVNKITIAKMLSMWDTTCESKDHYTQKPKWNHLTDNVWVSATSPSPQKN